MRTCRGAGAAAGQHTMQFLRALTESCASVSKRGAALDVAAALTAAKLVLLECKCKVHCFNSQRVAG
jgi:hypothetical protein